jgi:alkylated DNA repair dioxygenase AlkB
MERWLYNQDRIISNILPKDGTVNYYGKILTLKEANQYLDLLLQNILWQNSCLLNLYHDGNEGVGWHSDDEKSLGKNTIIASLSFGAERKFLLSTNKLNKLFHLFLNMVACL